MLISNLALETAGMVKVLHSFTFPALLSARFDTNIKFLNIFNHQLLIQTTLDIFERLVMKDVQNLNSGIKNLALETAGKVKVLHSFTLPAVTSARFDTNIGFLNVFNHWPLKQTTLDIFELLVMKDLQNFNSGIKNLALETAGMVKVLHSFTLLRSIYQCQV